MPAKILVADDEPNIVKLLHLYLREEGYEIVAARNGREALERFREPDLNGEVRFGLPEDFASVYLSGVLAEFARIHPRILLSIECDLTVNLFNRFKAAAGHVMAPPYVVKPNAEGSSVGVFLVFEGANSPPQEIVAPSWTFGEEVMIEPYIAGHELAVAVMDGKALAVTEIVARTGFYDYEAKYSDGGSQHIVPARIPETVAARAMAMAEKAHAALGCRGVTRSDLRYDEVKDNLVLLEVNTQPGMTPVSLAPEQAAFRGIDFQALVRWMVEDAYGRSGAGKVGS